MPLTAYCDNQGVVDSWKKGRSRNTPTNATFRRIHNVLASPPRRVFTKYVASADNPADGPSRGKFPPTMLLLLQTHINFPRFLPIFPNFLERLSHLAPIY
jgi:hypothetical protein